MLEFHKKRSAEIIARLEELDRQRADEMMGEVMAMFTPVVERMTRALDEESANIQDGVKRRLEILQKRN